MLSFSLPTLSCLWSVAPAVSEPNLVAEVVEDLHAALKDKLDDDVVYVRAADRRSWAEGYPSGGIIGLCADEVKGATW